MRLLYARRPTIRQTSVSHVSSSAEGISNSFYVASTRPVFVLFFPQFSCCGCCCCWCGQMSSTTLFSNTFPSEFYPPSRLILSKTLLARIRIYVRLPLLPSPMLQRWRRQILNIIISLVRMTSRFLATSTLRLDISAYGYTHGITGRMWHERLRPIILRRNYPCSHTNNNISVNISNYGLELRAGKRGMEPAPCMAARLL